MAIQIDKDSAGVKIPPPLAFAGMLVVGLTIDALSWWKLELPLGSKLENLLGMVALIAGFGIMMTAIGLFKKAGTDPKPWKPATAFVTDGVYRWTRNPMYLGMGLIYLGIAIYLDSLISVLLLVPVFVWITREVIEREEAYMAAKFGEPYLAYKAVTRRWF